MAEMTMYVITVALAVYGLSCFIRFIWSLIVRANRSSENVLLVPLRDENAEFSLRHAVALAKGNGIDRIAAVDCGLNDENRKIALMFANGEPTVSVFDSNEAVSKIIM